MYATLTILNYPRSFFFAGFLSMLFFRIALFGKRKKAFYKLMGTGRNGSFDLRADLRQWTIMSFQSTSPVCGEALPIEQIKKLHGRFIAAWIRFFKCETGFFVLEVCSGHGSWDKHPIFGLIGNIVGSSCPIAVFTRATIRPSKLRAFWSQVPLVNKKVSEADGLLFSIGTGEVPVLRQATFSIWTSVEAMKAFAYNDEAHAAVIRKTRYEKWYSEELFLRMNIIEVSGSVKGIQLDKILKSSSLC